MTDERLHTVADVARLLNLSRGHVMYLARRYLEGRGAPHLPCLRTPSGRVRFRADDVARIAAGRRLGAEVA